MNERGWLDRLDRRVLEMCREVVKENDAFFATLTSIYFELEEHCSSFCEEPEIRCQDCRIGLIRELLGAILPLDDAEDLDEIEEIDESEITLEEEILKEIEKDIKETKLLLLAIEASEKLGFVRADFLVDRRDK